MRALRLFFATLLATGCAADGVQRSDHISIPLQQGVTHERAVVRVKEALGLEAADFEDQPSVPAFQVPDFDDPRALSTGRFRIGAPIAASEKRLDQHRTRLVFTHSQRNPISSLDMGPPRGETVFVTTTVEVDTSSGDAALISFNTLGGDRSYTEWKQKGILDGLTAMARRAQPWQSK